MRTRPNLSLTAASSADLRAQLRSVEIAVPLVSEGRTKEHREQYMMARFLATADRAGRLAFPLEVVHGDRPDFRLRLGVVEIGMECVEAVPGEHYHIEDIRERHYPDAMNIGQRFEPDKQTLSITQKHGIASGQHAGPPWMPETAKRNWIAAMQYVVDCKTTKLRNGNYAANDSMWLLVQDEWPNPLRFDPHRVRAAASQLHELLRPLLERAAFKAVFIASGDQLLCFGTDRLSVEKICNLWG